MFGSVLCHYDQKQEQSNSREKHLFDSQLHSPSGLKECAGEAGEK